MHGHLVLVLTPAHYQQVAGHIFVQPNHPGPNPPNPHAFILQHNLQAQQDQYYSCLHRFQVYKNTDKAIIKQICAAFDEKFYKALQHGIVGYNNRSAADFLHHMYGNYGQINSTMITESEGKMAQPFNLAAPIEDLFE
eukprot:11677905-Ditylum_brightwellii.AAC.1